MTLSSCVRLIHIVNNNHQLSGLAAVYLWTNIEPDVAIICACLPIMMPLARSAREKLGHNFAPPRVHSKALSPVKSFGPRGQGGELSLSTTGLDGSTHIADGTEISTVSSRAREESLPQDEAARPIEETLAKGNLDVRDNFSACHVQV